MKMFEQGMIWRGLYFEKIGKKKKKERKNERRKEGKKKERIIYSGQKYRMRLRIKIIWIYLYLYKDVFYLQS